MGKDLKHKRSISDKFRDAMHSLKQISNAVLLHNDDDNEVEDLFETLNSEDEMIDNNYNSKSSSRSLSKSKSKSKLKLNSISKSIESSNNLINDSNSKNSNNNITSSHTSRTSSKSLKINSTSFSSDTPSISNKQIDQLIDNKLNTNYNNISKNINNNNFNSQIIKNDDNDNDNNNQISGAKLWEEQRNQWLKPTFTKSEIQKRKYSHSLGKLAEYNDDVYLSVYRNLVTYNKPLKRGLNMTDGFKVIYSGWENSKMFERIANGGVP